MQTDDNSDSSRGPELQGPVRGLPETLGAKDAAILVDRGSAVAIATPGRLAIYALRFEGGTATATLRCEHKLEGQAAAFADASGDLLLAMEDCDSTSLYRLTEDALEHLLDLPGKPAALGAAGTEAVLALDGAGRPPRLARIHLRQRRITAESALQHADVTIAVDPLDGKIILSDVAARTVTTLGPDLRELVGAVASQARCCDHRAPPSKVCCCLICCPDTDEKKPTRDPGREDEKPHGHDRPEGRDPGRPEEEPRDPHGSGPKRPGSAAIPAGDGGVVIANGGRVDRYPPVDRGDRPCGRDLFYGVEVLARAGAFFLASDRSGRTMSLLSADMNLLNEWSLQRGGARLLSSSTSSKMLMHQHSTGLWSWHDLDGIATAFRPDLTYFPVVPLESKTFIGQQVYALSHGTQPSPTEVKGLLLPVIEGEQTYNSPNLAGFADYMNRVMRPLARDYYDENSFGILKDVQVGIFGHDVGPAGGPLRLPRGKLNDYFYPAYDPARVELVKTGVTFAARVVFDGRETLKVNAKPLTGGPAGGVIELKFFALSLQHEADLYPVQFKFLGSERLTVNLTLPDGTVTTITLVFTAKTIDIVDDAALTTKLAELTGYLDNVMAAAESAAAITPRLFAAPSATLVRQIGQQFGRLVIGFRAANITGAKLQVTSTSSVHPAGDPIGLDDAIPGSIAVSHTFQLNRQLANACLIGQDAAGFGYNNRMLESGTANYDAAADTLTTSISISNRHGGPGAEVTFLSATDLTSLFASHTAKPNSATTEDLAESLRDRGDLYRDAFTAAIDRLRAAGQPTDSLKSFGCVLILPIEPATPNPLDPEAVLPGEVWNVTPLHRPIGFRGAENVTTVIDRNDEKVQLQSAWALIFMSGGKPDNAMIIHELGHALGFADLYHQNGYRDELQYLGDWAMMNNHPPMSHHCGYHKMQLGWIPEGAGTESDYGRIYPIGLPAPDVTRSWDLLLVPVEIWRDTLIGDSRTAFGVGAEVPVVQLAAVDLGGDQATFVLIEARQPTARFSRNLPVAGGGIIVTNGIVWSLDERFATNGWYRRPLHLLNGDMILQSTGQEFDLARAPELPVKGVKVKLTDRKTVDGVEVYRITVTRENAEFVDLYFSTADPYWKNPDLWIDWVGNNKPTAETLTPSYPPGQPVDQGEAIRVHPSNHEPHWVVARLRNRGQVRATDVKMNFFYFEPPGAGDGRKPMNVKDLSRYKLVGTITVPEVAGGDTPVNVPIRWDVPPGFKGHTCLLVQIEDYRIPEDSTGAALGSEDVWQINNSAQKNVDRFEALAASPYGPVEFDFSVHNDGVSPEFAYLEPDGLPYGMKLTVTPPDRLIESGKTALFRCKLELDEVITRRGCQNDQRFRIHAWRQDPESSIRWGGVEYEIRPREKTTAQIGGWWDYSNDVEVDGTVTPDPGGGTVRIRIDFAGQQARWVTTQVVAGGKFVWKERAPANSFTLDAIAWFEGNRRFGSARSNPIRIKPPPVIA